MHEFCSAVKDCLPRKRIYYVLSQDPITLREWRGLTRSAKSCRGPGQPQQGRGPTPLKRFFTFSLIPKAALTELIVLTVYTPVMQRGVM